MHGLIMDFHLPLMFTVAVNLDFCMIKGKVVLHAALHLKHVCSVPNAVSYLAGH